jgi:hypothetical protein
LKRPTFPEKRDGWRARIEKRLQVPVFPDRVAGFPRRAKRYDGRIPKRYGFDLPEELNVLGIGPRPSAFDEMDTEVIELLRHPKLVFHGETDVLGLSPITQRRIIDL